MNDRNGRDVARQAANLAGAILQVGVPLFVGERIARVATETRSLVDPGDYAFAIWSLLYLLSLAYAVYQALPANRKDPLLRRIGPFTAGAFALNGLWEILVPLRQFLLAEVSLVGIFVCLAVAYLHVMRSERTALGGGGRWLVAMPLGLLFGWITAANAVSFTTTLIGYGLLNGGLAEAALGSTLLLVGGVAASSVILATKAGVPQGYAAYAAAVLWAYAGIVLNKYGASAITTAVALLCVVLVSAALLVAYRATRAPREQPAGATASRAA
jgi:hypothetical protein